MEKKVKIDVIEMKNDIKVKAELQKFYKNQMKTEKIVGERKIPVSDANYRHLINRSDLRILYAAYGIARGKSFSQIENHYSEINHPLQKERKTIDRILKEYEYLINEPVLE